MSEPFDGIKNGLQDVLEITKKDKMLELANLLEAADRCEKNAEATRNGPYVSVREQHECFKTSAEIMRALAEKEGE